MSPRQIVAELDKYVIGQDKAKRTIAVALRNRTRRKRLPESIKDEVYPKNIIMIGPTGVGKTEIARRIARLSNAPFIKVEATKYTEVGYVGRDVESMVRDLMGSAVSMVRRELAAQNEKMVRERVEERLLDVLIPNVSSTANTDAQFDNARISAREQIRVQLRAGLLDNTEVEIPNQLVRPKVGIELMGGSMDDIQNAMNSLGSIFQNAAQGPRNKKRKVTIKRARELFTEEETERSVDQEKATEIAKERTEQMGIIFIDEIDKIAGKNSSSSSPDVSREGVQRDILPIVEGTKVTTKWGVIDTSHILFIAAGAFHVSKPSDLIPELQGRFPLRVELDALSADDFYRILKEPENAITLQYRELLRTEGVEVVFTDDALHRVSEIAYEVNSSTENIGARRLYTIMETLLDELSFNASEMSGQTVEITPDYVNERLSNVVKDQDLSRYIL
ncbi:MAG: ATP-dependent protease ATPase subunit HslU [Spirochaetales bacterium]|nr:ATP-dependent protease ATPase subunit HslU [Spirochaetales bacterium]MCR5442141.1 ATP-dependent protease ATPase subunit HslU [Sphaerochaetaceae bacterium]